jgi:hypothetical protein
MTTHSKLTLKILIPILAALLGILSYSESKFAPKEPTESSLLRIEGKVDRLLFELVNKK